MNKENKVKYLPALKELYNKIEDLSKIIKENSEDIAYNIKLYFRKVDIDPEKWCRENDLSYENYNNDLKNENFYKLKEYLHLILYKKKKKFSIYNEIEIEDSNKIGVNNVIKSLNSKDTHKLWASISYYILMNHKNIRTFCKNFEENNFNVKYTTFRTDKYNKGINTAIKYANMILEYVKRAK